jgi:cell division protein ZapA
MSTKQIEVQIMGQSYLLGCPEGGEDKLLAAVGRVDAAMCKIRDAGRIKARDRIAVLAALNLAFDHNEAHVPAAASFGSGEVPASSERLSGLLQRLDQVLGQDGRLI